MDYVNLLSATFLDSMFFQIFPLKLHVFEIYTKTMLFVKNDHFPFSLQFLYLLIIIIIFA